MRHALQSCAAFGRERYVHDVVCVAVCVRCYSLEHLCSQAGEEGNQLHGEPGNPVVALEVFKMEAEDGEGSIHHDVPHHRIDVHSLEEKTNKQRAVFCFFCLFFLSSNIGVAEAPWILLAHRK